MNTVKVILATLVIFGAGVITGAIAIRVALIRVPLQQSVTTNTAPALPATRILALGTPFNRPDFLERLNREASLKPGQRDRIEQILRESRQRTEPLSAQEFAPRIRTEVQLVRGQILQVLDTDQRAHFDEIMRPRERSTEPPRDPFSRQRARNECDCPARALSSCGLKGWWDFPV